jgi:branched-subunit amino acid transport protein
MAFATYLTRYTMMALIGQKTSLDAIEEHSLFQRWLRYVPPGVLAGLIVPEVLAPKAHLEVGLPLWSFLVGCIAAWRTKSVIWTILAGIAAFWILQFLVY